ncbi:MAG: hypothetical protein ACXAEF_10920 [Candidatus Thorarchaeota archaeon]|jgi:hypothetical protein
MSDVNDAPDTLDIGGLFRGTATITFIAEIVAIIMILGSSVAYFLSRGTFIEDLDLDMTILLLMIGSMVTLFIFLGAISFFIRFNRRVQGAVIGKGIGEVDLKGARVKTVLTLYGLAVGLILIIGMYMYWIIWRNWLAAIAATSLSFLMLSVSVGMFVLALLIQMVVIALGRTATGVIEAVLKEQS